MARTKANHIPRTRPSLSTQTSHTGPFVRVASSPAHPGGVSSVSSSQAPRRERADSHEERPRKRIKAASVELLAAEKVVRRVKKHKEKHSSLKTIDGSSGKKAKKGDAALAVPDAARRKLEASGGKKSVRRFRPGTVALREIRRYQKSVDCVIPRAPMQRLVRDVVGELVNKEAYPSREAVRFRADALLAVREGMEHWMIRALECTNLAAFHGRRVTITPKDLALIRRVRSM